MLFSYRIPPRLCYNYEGAILLKTEALLWSCRQCNGFSLMTTRTRRGVQCLQSADVAVVVNPASGGGLTGKRWPKIAAALEEEGLKFVASFTKGPGDATEITRRYLLEGYNLIVSVGGDGTNNEVVNGFFYDGGAVRESAAVGFISTGTGSDLIRTLGIPRDFKGAARHLVKSPIREVDVGRVFFINHRGASETSYFIDIAGLGLDAETVGRVNRTSKTLGGFISFFWGTVVSLLLYRNKEMAVTVDGELVCEGKVTTVIIGNGCFFGGGMNIAPEARMDDGLFDVIVLEGLSKRELLINLPGVYKGKHMDNPKIIFLKGKNIAVTSPEGALLNLDGEQPGRAPADIELLPRAIKIKS